RFADVTAWMVRSCVWARSMSDGYILLVDDDASVREAITDALEEAGYAVMGAENGRVALDLLAQRPVPDLMLLDLWMPVMNGWQVVDAMRERGLLDRVPVVVLTAALDAGPSLPSHLQVMRKPFSLDSLLSVVRGHCAPQS